MRGWPRWATATSPSSPATVCRRLADAGVGFRSVGGEAEFNLDPVPRVLGAGEWERLEAGLAQRVRALNAFVADAYGPRRAVAEGVLPERVITDAPGYEPQMAGSRPPGDLWVGVAGLDLVRDAHGELLVLEDNLTTPSGLAYAVAARAAVLEALEPDDAATLRSTGWARCWAPRCAPRRRTAASPRSSCSPTARTTARSGSTRGRRASSACRSSSPATWSCAATACCTRGARSTWSTGARTPTGSTRTWGPCSSPAVRAGTLAVVNAFGTGVADDKVAHAYVEAMIEFYLGEKPLLGSVETLDLERPEVLERALDEFEELVIKPRRGYGGIGVVICPHAEPEDVEAARKAVRAAPGEFVAQPLVTLSFAPTVIDGELAPRHVDLRPFIFLRADGSASVMPGGLTRVAFGEGALVVNSTQNGGAKDTWVLP